MFDIGWTELLLIGVVALIVIGPEDLPDMFRQLGRFTGKLRSMSRDFQRAMDQAAKEAGVSDIAKDINTIASPKGLGLNAVRDAADKFEKWDPLKNAARPTVATPKPATPVAAAVPAPAAEVAAVTEVTAAEGPATTALRAKKAAKAAILKDTVAQLKAVDAGDVPAKAAPNARRKTAAGTVAAVSGTGPAVSEKPAKTVAKRKAPRKDKSAAE